MKRLPRAQSELHLARKLRTPDALTALELNLIAREIRKMRKKATLSQLQLAKKNGTSQSAIARIENGRQNLTLSLLIKISVSLGARVDITFRRSQD